MREYKVDQMNGRILRFAKSGTLFLMVLKVLKKHTEYRRPHLYWLDNAVVLGTTQAAN